MDPCIHGSISFTENHIFHYEMKNRIRKAENVTSPGRWPRAGKCWFIQCNKRYGSMDLLLELLLELELLREPLLVLVLLLLLYVLIT